MRSKKLRRPAQSPAATSRAHSSFPARTPRSSLAGMSSSTPYTATLPKASTPWQTSKPLTTRFRLDPPELRRTTREVNSPFTPGRRGLILRRARLPYGNMTTFIEGDFFGADGNETVTNSNGFRIRHAYGTLGNFLAGQYWTNLF